MSQYVTKLSETWRNMSEVEAAWVGAMIEAEGAVTYVNGNQGKRDYWMIQVANCDVEIISALLRATGMGRVCLTFSKLKNPRYQPQWRWAVAKIEDVQELARRLWPYSGKMQKITGRYP